MNLPFEHIISDIEKSIVKQIGEAKLVNIPYSGLFTLPESFISNAWERVDKDALNKKLAERIESELIDRIVNHMAAEISTDIKQVLSTKERRESIRAVCRKNLDLIVGSK